PGRHDLSRLPLGRVPGGSDVMVVALKHDERFWALLKLAPLRVGARDMDLQYAEPRAGSVEDEWDRIGDQPLGAVADEKAEHAGLDQRVQLGQILVLVERGFVQGGLVARSCGPFRREC